MKQQESSSPTRPPEAVKWYMDPRFWLFMIGLLAWVISAFMEGNQVGTLKP